MGGVAGPTLARGRLRSRRISGCNRPGAKKVECTGLLDCLQRFCPLDQAKIVRGQKTTKKLNEVTMATGGGGYNTDRIATDARSRS